MEQSLERAEEGKVDASSKLNKSRPKEDEITGFDAGLQEDHDQKEATPSWDDFNALASRLSFLENTLAERVAFLDKNPSPLPINNGSVSQQSLHAQERPKRSDIFHSEGEEYSPLEEGVNLPPTGGKNIGTKKSEDESYPVSDDVVGDTDGERARHCGMIGPAQAIYPPSTCDGDSSIGTTHHVKRPESGGIPYHDSHALSNGGGGGPLSYRNNLRRWSIFETSDLDINKSIEVPESVYILLFTEEVYSRPFAFAIGIASISICIMILVVVSYMLNETSDNPLKIPAGVTVDVRVAQYLGIVVGLIMEQEIAQGLAFLRLTTNGSLNLNNKKLTQWKLIFSSVCRLIIGYLFLLNLTIVTATADDVLTIFYNIMALEFVQNIDDIAFTLAKYGTFGRIIGSAANKKNVISVSDHESHHQSSRICRRFPFKWLYFLNALALLLAITSVAVRQNSGEFRCNSFTVTFGDEVWEEANVRTADDKFDKRTLLYSYFNGVYRISDGNGGFPVYVEQNKENGKSYNDKVGAEFKYCKEIGAWVFTHPDIRKSNYETGSAEVRASLESFYKVCWAFQSRTHMFHLSHSFDANDTKVDCSWLLRSAKTKQQSLVDAATMDWTIWVGRTNTASSVSAVCNECKQESDCNYQGTCVEKKCQCFPGFSGIHCEFEQPCKTLYTQKVFETSDKSQHVFLHLAEKDQGEPVTSYGRPIYIAKNLTGKPMGLLNHETAVEYITYFPTYSPTISLAPSNVNNSSLVPTLSPIPSVSPTQSPLPTLGRDDDYFSDDDFFYVNWKLVFDIQYSVALVYTGSRWFATIQASDSDVADTYNIEYHAFWDQTFKSTTFLVSSPTSEEMPIGVDFFETRRRDDEIWNFTQYGPFGVALPLVNVEGGGFFQCYDDLVDFCRKSFHSEGICRYYYELGS